MKKSCIAWLLVWAAASAGVHFYIESRAPIHPPVWVSIAGGFLFTIGLGYWWGIIDRVKQRARIRRGLAGEGFEDGARVAAFGTVVADGPLLTSPFQQKPCVAYSYEIQSDARQGAKYYDGFVMTPCAIQTYGGKVRLLAWPELAYDAAYPFGDETKRRAAAFVESTQFTKFAGIREAWNQLKELSSDADGTIQHNVEIAPWSPELSAVFCERILAPGDEVCATGRYSAMHQGFVPDTQEVMQSIKIQKGRPEEVLRSGTGAVAYFIFGALFIGAGVAGLMFFDRIVQALR